MSSNRESKRAVLSNIMHMAPTTLKEELTGYDLKMVDISEIVPDENNPRKNPNDNIEELVSTVKQYGLQNPILVREEENHYKIISGHRRYFACMKAQLPKIPIIVKKANEKEALILQLIENLQREDLNPLEEAVGIKRAMETLELNQNQIAEKIGKSRTRVTMTLGILKTSWRKCPTSDIRKIYPRYCS